MRKIWVSYEDGRYFWMEPEWTDQTWGLVEIPVWRYWWLRVASAIERIVQRPVDRYLAGLDNDRETP